jgi:hypothetical protein
MPLKTCLPYGLVNSCIFTGACDFPEKFQAFLFGWRLDADTSVSSYVYSVISIFKLLYFAFYFFLLYHSLPLSN